MNDVTSKEGWPHKAGYELVGASPTQEDLLKQADAAYKAHLEHTGGPATEATWLDMCAWHALGGTLSASETDNVDKAAAWSYQYAQAMLAEKRRIEGGGQ